MLTNTQTTPEVTTYNMYSCEYRDTHTSEFLVTIDGDINYDWHEQHDKEQRRDYLKQYARQTASKCVRMAVEAVQDFAEYCDNINRQPLDN